MKWNLARLTGFFERAILRLQGTDNPDPGHEPEIFPVSYKLLEHAVAPAAKAASLNQHDPEWAANTWSYLGDIIEEVMIEPEVAHDPNPQLRILRDSLWDIANAMRNRDMSRQEIQLSNKVFHDFRTTRHMLRTVAEFLGEPLDSNIQTLTLSGHARPLFEPKRLEKHGHNGQVLNTAHDAIEHFLAEPFTRQASHRWWDAPSSNR